MQPLLAIAKDTEETHMLRLARRWKEIDERKTHGEAECDVDRASVLEEYIALGLTLREIHACTGQSTGRVGQLLQYGRFIKVLSTDVDKIPEGRFRRYWASEVDHSAMTLLRGKKNEKQKLEYEQRVFQQIVERIKEGEEPTNPSYKHKAMNIAKNNGLSDKQLQSLEKKMHKFQLLKRKEVQEAYREIQEDLKIIKELGENTGMIVGPGNYAVHAKRLEMGIRKILQACHEDVDVWLGSI